MWVQPLDVDAEEANFGSHAYPTGILLIGHLLGHSLSLLKALVPFSLLLCHSSLVSWFLCPWEVIAL